jgi:S1-C subfamily serine protease
MKSLIHLILALAVPGVSLADEEVPLITPDERQAVDAQVSEFSAAITPALATVAKSTVRVWSGSQRVAYGTVIGDGTKILTKWSEVASSAETLRIDSAGNDYRDTRLSGIYPDADLAVLTLEGKALTPVSWTLGAPKLGSFLAAPQPDGGPAAYGVVSVLERNLRDTDLAFLGVIGDRDYNGPGVKIESVSKNSGADTANLKPGSVILKIGSRAISGLLELKNALVGIAPGTTVPLVVETQGTTETVQVLLGHRPNLPQIPGDRIEAMERMGGTISQVRNSFTHAIQTDMRPKPNQIGGPVVNLKGEAVGITLARADRTRSFIMPAAAVVELLKQEAQNPDSVQAKVEVAEMETPSLADSNGPKGRVIPGGEDRVQRHVFDMQRLMDHLQEEMDSLQDR